MTSEQEPLLRRNSMTGRVYVITRYRTSDAGDVLEALKKYDVTEDFNALAAAPVSEGRP